MPIRPAPMALVALAAVACFPDDWDGQPYQPYTTPTPTIPTTDTGPVDEAGLVGTWTSEGSDISDLFRGVPFFYVSVEANFRADGTVSTTIRDDEGATYLTSGTWAADESTEPASITLEQAEPYVAFLAGIYQVDGDELTYEVVQLSPDYGYAAPTPESGFGTTTGPNLIPGVNVQTFERN